MSQNSHKSSAGDNRQRAPPDQLLGQEFKEIFENEIGRSISEEDAREYANALIALIDLFISLPTDHHG